MLTKNVGKSERVLRIVVGLILLLVGYKLSGVYALLAYFFGAIMLLTGILSWCWLYSLLDFSSRGKGINRIPKSEIERVVREHKIVPMKVSIVKSSKSEKKVVKVADKKSAPSKKKTVAKKAPAKKTVAKKTAAKKVVKKAPAKKAVAKKTTTKKVVKKAPAKKAETKKPAVKKAAPKKKTVAKKTATKKAPVKKTTTTKKKATSKK